MRRDRVPKVIFWLVLGILLGAIPASFIGYARGGGPGTDTASFQEVTSSPGRAVFPGAQVNYTGSGTFKVPDQAPPGTYMLTAASNTYGCSWKRLKSLDGKLRSTIDGRLFNKSGFDTFTVARTDRYVMFIGDCTWRLSG